MSKTGFTLDNALAIAVQAHTGQKDKGLKPYFLHPLRVMMAQTSITAMMVACLHDSIEDSEGAVTIASLRAVGCPEEVLDALDLLTFPKGLTDDQYLDRIKTIKLNPLARAVKLSDLDDNLNLKRIKGLGSHFPEKDMLR